MRRCVVSLAVALAVVASASVNKSVQAQSVQRYLVSITNMTRAQSFTPILVATHTSAVRLFTPGTAASSELREVAEEGNIGPLTTLLRGRPLEVRDIASSSGLLTPGVTVDVVVMAGGQFDRVSLVSMLIPTNDAFFGATGLPLPAANEITIIDVPAYDSGTEQNDERCASIPGPDFSECGGPGGGARVGGGEGVVIIHNGIHGVGDLRASNRDWRNPVARIIVRRQL
ncbi:MAG: hypothetical protein FJW14_01305 [Acidimicrobiia bacterium]|nr:hypothetical protein [Acidimicrobiia bacterium]